MTNVSVPFFDNSLSFTRLWSTIRERLDEIFADGKYNHGLMVNRFERMICEYTGAKYAIGVNSGTDALMLLLRAAGIGPGDEVIVPCFTFFASASSIVNVGAKPVFVDVEPSTYCLNVSKINNLITDRTKGIMPVHLFCQMADMHPLLVIAERAGLSVIEDSAESIGMRYQGTHSGLHADGGVFSFYPSKTLGAIGDAGMIVTNHEGIASKLCATHHLKHNDKTAESIAEESQEPYCYNSSSKMDDIQAAVLVTKLAELDKNIRRRAALAKLYDERLQKLAPSVSIPKFVKREQETNPVYYVYVIEAKQKNRLVQYLKTINIETEEYYPVPLHLQPCFNYLGYSEGDFPVAENACKQTVALPFYPDITSEAVTRVCDAIEHFYNMVEN